ncbi:Hypothetical protein, putative, partial [Bodo saltans]
LTWPKTFLNKTGSQLRPSTLSSHNDAALAVIGRSFEGVEVGQGLRTPKPHGTYIAAAPSPSFTTVQEALEQNVQSADVRVGGFWSRQDRHIELHLQECWDTQIDNRRDQQPRQNMELQRRCSAFRHVQSEQHFQ